MSTPLLRWSIGVALTTAVAWCGISLVSIIEREPKDYIDALVLVPFTLTAVAFLGLHGLQRVRLNRFGRISFGLAAFSMVALLVSQTTIVAGSDRLNWLAFPLGAIAWLVGFACYGYATARASVLPARIGWSLAIAEPLTIVLGIALSPIVPLADSGSFSGALGHAFVWFGIAALLRQTLARHQIANLRSPAGRSPRMLAADHRS